MADNMGDVLRAFPWIILDTFPHFLSVVMQLIGFKYICLLKMEDDVLDAVKMRKCYVPRPNDVICHCMHRHGPCVICLTRFWDWNPGFK